MNPNNADPEMLRTLKEHTKLVRLHEKQLFDLIAYTKYIRVF